MALGFDSAANRNEYQESSWGKGRRKSNPTATYEPVTMENVETLRALRRQLKGKSADGGLWPDETTTFYFGNMFRRQLNLDLQLKAARDFRSS
jgi:ribosomal protein L19E